MKPPLYQPLWSEWIIAETWRVLTQRRLARGDNPQAISRQANTMMRLLLPIMELAPLRHALASSNTWPDLLDADDAPIWDTAVAGRAQFVISYNTTDFPPLIDELHGAHRCSRHVWRGIEYLTPAEFFVDLLGLTIPELSGRWNPTPNDLRRSGRVCPSRSSAASG